MSFDDWAFLAILIGGVATALYQVASNWDRFVAAIRNQ